MLSRRITEDQCRLLFRKSSQATAVVQDDRIVLCNPSAEKFWGYKESELRKIHFLELTLAEDRNRARQDMIKRLEDREPVSRPVYRMRRHDGDVFWVESGGIRIDWEGAPAWLAFFSETKTKLRHEDREKVLGVHLEPGLPKPSGDVPSPVAAPAAVPAAIAVPAVSAVYAVPAAQAADPQPVASAPAPSGAGGPGLDPLTGLFGRAAFDVELKRIDKESFLPVTILLAVLDDFEEYREHFGDAAGDELVRNFAGFLKKECRESDFLARIDEERFALVLPRTDSWMAEGLERRVSEDLAASKGGAVPFSATFGKQTRDKMDMDFDQAFAAASDRLDRRKKMHEIFKGMPGDIF